jgi:hypothetical protein
LCPAPNKETQIQDRFSGVSLSRLCSLSAAELVELLGEIEVCPSCGGVGCVVRLGFTSGR